GVAAEAAGGQPHAFADRMRLAFDARSTVQQASGARLPVELDGRHFNVGLAAERTATAAGERFRLRIEEHSLIDEFDAELGKHLFDAIGTGGAAAWRPIAAVISRPETNQNWLTFLDEIAEYLGLRLLQAMQPGWNILIGLDDIAERQPRHNQ